jgi:hypothetical protein
MGFFSDIAPIASLAAGVHTGNPGLIAGGLGALGSSAQGQAAQQGNQQAAQLTQFRPVGITNTFGTSNFGYDPNTGQMTSAGYNLSPTLQGAQNTLMSGLGTNLQDQANIQAMGRQYMAQSPQEAAQNWMNQQQALLQPSRDMAQAKLNNSMFNSGTGGLSVAQGTGMGMANPQQQAEANAQALQNLQLASQAQQQGQNQYTFGQNLLSSAYDPYNTGLKSAAATEQLGQNPFTMSQGLASAATGANANSAGYLKNATSYSPFGSLLSGAANNPQLLNGLGDAASNLWDQFNNPLSIDTAGQGMGAWGGVDTGSYGGAGGLSIR